jgi:hypothetical protein
MYRWRCEVKDLFGQPTVLIITRVAWTLSILSNRVQAAYEDEDDNSVSRQLHELHLVLRLCVLALGGEAMPKEKPDDAEARAEWS